MKASAIANPNIALVKYWGKRDETLMLPYNSSISFTVSDFTAHTTVEFDEKYQEDIFILNDHQYEKGSKVFDKYIQKFLSVVREETGNDLRVKIKSENNFPSGAGLASSAAGFAALATAINEALDLGLERKELSMLARRGSGSATRSVWGGFVKWNRGERKDGSDSFSEQIAGVDHWPEFRMIACIVSREEKKVSSRAGMAQTIDTCPFYSQWLESVDQDLEKVEKAIKDKDFSLLGATAESNCLKMHALMMTTNPSLLYWNPVTMRLVKKIKNWRGEGRECYFTIDAGPQVKVMCLEENVSWIIDKCRSVEGVKEVKVLEAGKNSWITDRHLF